MTLRRTPLVCISLSLGLMGRLVYLLVGTEARSGELFFLRILICAVLLILMASGPYRGGSEHATMWVPEITCMLAFFMIDLAFPMAMLFLGISLVMEAYLTLRMGGVTPMRVMLFAGVMAALSLVIYLRLWRLGTYRLWVLGYLALSAWDLVMLRPSRGASRVGHAGLMLLALSGCLLGAGHLFSMQVWEVLGQMDLMAGLLLTAYHAWVA
ncbi:MAG: hypothetical protein IJ083_00755 [Clostridia bacterium]|nr:hypothetical protein [Clostridia bacterium]